MATSVVPYANLRQIHNTLQMEINDSESRDTFISFIAMAPAEQYAIPPLLHGVCPSQAAELCIRTVTSSRCWLLPCLDLGNGFHISHSSLCILDKVWPSPAHSLRRNTSNSYAINLTHNPAMARLRHRMRSRRGGTRGGIIQMPASTSFATVSPDSSTETLNPLNSPSRRYLNTRSGKGQASSQASDFPLPPYPAPHSTQFRFRNTLNRPIITATVTISFVEESKPQSPPSGLTDKQNREASSCRGISIPGNMHQNEGRAALHGKAIAGGSSAKDEKHNGTKASRSRPNDTFETQMGTGGTEEAPPTQGHHVSDADDDWYQFAGRIEEEPAPEDPLT